jgi:WD repeat-containing protein 17
MSTPGGSPESYTARKRGAVSLRTTRLCPAGVQPWFIDCITAGADKIAYCATLAIYIFQKNTYSLYRVINAHSNTITSLSFSPAHQNVLASSAVDKSIIIWNVDTGEKLASYCHRERVMRIDWNFSGTKLAFLDLGEVFLWKIPQWEGTGTVSSLGEVSKYGPAQTLKWHSQVKNMLAIGLQRKGKIVVIMDGAGNRSGASVRCTLFSKSVEKESPARIGWDTRSSTYLLAGYSEGSICLWDIDAQTIMQTYEWPRGDSLGVLSLFWVHGQPGTFLTVDKKGRRLRTWNASQTKSLGAKLIGQGGGTPQKKLLAACPMSCGSNTGRQDDQKIICAFVDGSIGVYNVKNNVLEYESFAGHRETIFGIQFSPVDPDILATGSYDGKVKVWHYPTMTVRTVVDFGAVVYALSFSPCGTKLAVAGEAGRLSILELCASSPSGEELNKSNPRPVKFKLYKCHWNPQTGKNILLSGENPNAVVLDEHGEITQRYPHPKNLYGSKWHPSDPNLFVTGCWDGVVRVFEKKHAFPTMALEGHQSRVFNCEWSPIHDHIIASGSDDMTIRVWDTNLKAAVHVLRGHTDKVRAITWCKELPFLLFSGSWDSTIRLWNTADEDCLLVIEEHHADVYTIATSKAHPFQMVSSSRDSTMRIWNLVGRLKWQLIGSFLTGAFGDRTQSSLASPILCGEGSQALRNVRSGTSLANLTSINALVAGLEFLHGGEGFVEFMTILRIVHKRMFGQDSDYEAIEERCDLDDRPGRKRAGSAREQGPDKEEKVFKTSRIPYPENALESHLEEAKQLKMSGMMRGFSGVGEMTSRDKVLLAASKYLLVGEIRNACEALVHVEEWERALSLAPGHSLEYWKKLSNRYAKSLEKEEKEKSLDYFIACGNIDKAEELLIARRDWYNTVLLAESARSGAIGRSIRNQSRKSRAESLGDEDGERAASGRLKKVIGPLAEYYVLRKEPLMAAGCHLAVHNITAAIETFVDFGDEQAFPAFVLATIFKDSLELDCDEIFFNFAKKLRDAGQRELGVTIIEQFVKRSSLFLNKLDTSSSEETKFQDPDQGVDEEKFNGERMEGKSKK